MYCSKLWDEKDLSHVPAVAHGRDHEKICIKQFEKEHDCKVTKTGLHISKEYPHIGKFSIFLIQS